MKRHIQKTGVRRFFGQDLVELQAEPLKALDAFFAAYGACIIEGCAVSEADGGTFTVAPGLVALESTDPESGVVAVRTMPCAGAEGVALPLYLTAQWQVIERVYDDGKVKPIGYDLSAVASGIAPEAPHLLLTAAGGHRFVDAVQDGTHRFVSDAERSKWNGVLQQAKEYAGLQAEAAKRSAIEHTEATAAAVRGEMAVADQAAVRSAKEYADRIVAALVDNSPELLNTLEELAAALGGDPEFATTVMKAIGERATMTEVNTALAGKADTTHGHASVAGLDWYNTAGTALVDGHYVVARRTNPLGPDSRLYLREGTNWHDKVAVHKADKADNVPWTGVSDKPNATPTAAGLMSGGDKAKLDGIDPSLLVKRVGYANPTGGLPAVPFYDYSAVVGMDVGNVEVSAMLNMPAAYGYVVQLRLSDYLGRLSASIRGNNSKTWHELYGTHNLKIIRGSVDAIGGNGGGNAYNIENVYGEPAVVRVTHNLNTTAYSAQATAVSNTNSIHTDNVVTVWRKTANYVDFMVTAGPDAERELCAFDYLIIPY